VLLAASVGACVRGTACGPPPDPTEVIAVLWSQIREWRHEAGLPNELDAHGVAFSAPILPACLRDASLDSDICILATAICDNAEQICIRSGELGDNPWARNTCASATRSCSDVVERCCALGSS
jgi:hypothetical protein